MMPAIFTNSTEFTIQVRDPEILTAVFWGIGAAYGAVFIGQRTCIDIPNIKFLRGTWTFNRYSDFFCFRFPAYEVVSIGGSIQVIDNVNVGLFLNNVFNEEVILYKRSYYRDDWSLGAQNYYYGDERNLQLRLDFNY